MFLRFAVGLLVAASSAAAAAPPEVLIGSSSTGITYARQFSSWERQGNLAFYRIDLTLSSASSLKGAVSIETNFPIPTASDHFYTACPSVYADNVVGEIIASCYFSSGSTRIDLRKYISGGTTALTSADITDNLTLLITGFYVMDDGLIAFEDAVDRPWFEFAETTDGSLLVSYNVHDGVAIRRNRDDGLGDWELLGVLPYVGYENSSAERYYAPMSRLSNGNVAIVVVDGNVLTPDELGWIEIRDNGDVFGDINPIVTEPGTYHFGPLLELGDGKLGLSSHEIDGDTYTSFLNVADDGETWNRVEILPPLPGNNGPTEAAVLPVPGGYLALVRTDEKEGVVGLADGGYAVRGGDLDEWGVPVDLGIKLRMPRFVDARRFWVSFRRYEAGASGSAQQVGVIAPFNPVTLDLGESLTEIVGANNAPFPHEGFAYVQAFTGEPERYFRRVPLN